MITLATVENGLYKRGVEKGGAQAGAHAASAREVTRVWIQIERFGICFRAVIFTLFHLMAHIN